MSINENAWVPRVLPGGKSPPGDGDTPYLMYLKNGAIFLAKDITSKDPIDLTLFRIVRVFNKARLISEKNANTGDELYHYVNPITFCQRFKLYEVLLEGKEDDESGNRADSSTSHENNELAEGVNLLDEKTKG